MKRKNIILIISGFIVAITFTSIITTIIVKKNSEIKINNTTNKLKNEAKIQGTKELVDIENSKAKEKSVENKVKEETINDDSNKTTNNLAKEKTTENKNVIEKNKENNDDNVKKIQEENNTNNPIKTEDDVISYVESISNESIGDKLKVGFITVIDFLFYEGEIYDKTFKELSSSAKIKIISFALKIDSKIDEYYPGYKETISSKTNKIYTNIKNKLITLYLDTTVKICTNNITLCEDAKNGLKELKDSFGLTWDFIKDISGIGLTKLKDWYEVWKEE